MDIKTFWNDIIFQNRERLASYFDEEAVILWHCTNEQFTVSEYVRVNCEYPGSWKGDLERLEQNGDEIILAGHIYSDDGRISCHVVSFINLKLDKIIRMEEYWSDDGEAPEWREAMKIGSPITSISGLRNTCKE